MVSAQSNLNSLSKTLCIGVISDTHIPDRVGSLHPDVLDTFKDKEVDHILHAGDISSRKVISQLSDIAPVTMAKGNRDFFLGENYPLVIMKEFNGVKVAITHGHGGWLPYFLDKFPYILMGYRFERYQKKLQKMAGDAKVIVYGHTHHAENRWVEGKLYFNAGSAYDVGKDRRGPSIGLLEITENQKVKAEIIPLRKAKWHSRSWIMKE